MTKKKRGRWRVVSNGEIPCLRTTMAAAVGAVVVDQTLQILSFAAACPSFEPA